MRPEDNLLALVDVHRRFGGVLALRGADLSISGPGVVHGLIGENGSGKSTLLGVLSGQLRPDRGDLFLAGESTTLRTPTEALQRGIALVSQEVAVAPDLSVAENILMGHRFSGRAGRIRWSQTRQRAGEVLGELGVDYDVRRTVASLRPDQRQMVEIARALSMDAKVLILDEPTSSLTRSEVEGLFATLQALKARGVSIIFVSHRLTEFFEVVDELTVLRDGRTVAAGPIGAFDETSLVDAMVGEVPDARVSATAAGRALNGSHSEVSSALRVRGLHAKGLLDDVALDVHAGEIVGLVGLSGAGRSELLECAFGVRPFDAGTIEVFGDPLAPRSPRAAIERKIGYLPPDRKTQGLVLSMSVRDNLLTIAELDRNRIARPSRTQERTVTQKTIEQLKIRVDAQETPVGSLSGGNQQKVALGRWLVAGSKLLLLDEPTRGVDVSAKAEIHRLLRDAASDGLALLISSSETEELMDVCDRLIVVFRGRVVADLKASDANEATLARYAGGMS